jgi:hypothetical protein
MIAIVLFSFVLGLFRLNPTVAVAVLFSSAFTYWIVLGQSKSWTVATVPFLGIVTGLILLGLYYLVRRFSPFRKAVPKPLA